jgi:cell division septum initiation protein DivIVA
MDIKIENRELKQKIAELREHLDTKDKIISDLENNVVLLSNYLDTTVATIDTPKDRMQSLEAITSQSTHARAPIEMT